MPVFSRNSLNKLVTCDPKLQQVFAAAIRVYDFTVLHGIRSEEEQNQLFAEGKSKLQYPKSKHNSRPSKAIDVAPYPVDFNDTKRFYYLAGVVKGIAASLGIKIRWGGDWDSDGDFKDNTFQDLCHFELVD